MSPSAENSLPRRALVVDSDPAVREATAAMLKLQGFEVESAGDGAEALTLFARDWYPLVITDRNIQTLDGVEFVARLRVIALAPVYVIMLTDSADVRDHELGFCAGVDQYVVRRNTQQELVARTLSGMTALRRRQSSRTGRANEPATVDLENGAHTARHLVGRLRAEIVHATRARGLLQILSVGIDTVDEQVFARQGLGASASATLLSVVHAAMRPRLDWVARLPAAPNTCRLAIVMPESAAADAARLEQDIRNAFVHWNTGSAASAVRLTAGVAALSATDETPTALEFLGQAERQRRGKDSPVRTTLSNVQRESEPAQDAA